MPDELTFQQKNALELMQAHTASIREAINTLEDKAQQNISISSIIIAIIGSFNALGTNVQGGMLFTQTEIVLIFLAYAVLFVAFFIARRPALVATHPMRPTWEELQKWLGLNEEEFYDKLVASYSDIVRDNELVMKRKARAVNVGVFFLGIDILVIALSAATNIG